MAKETTFNQEIEIADLPEFQTQVEDEIEFEAINNYLKRDNYIIGEFDCFGGDPYVRKKSKKNRKK